MKRRLLDLFISLKLYGRYAYDIDLALEVPEKGMFQEGYRLVSKV